MLVTSRKPRPLRTVLQHKVIKSDSESSSVEVVHSQDSQDSSSENEEVDIGVVDGEAMEHLGSIEHLSCLSGKKNRKKRRRLKRRSGSLGAQTEHGVKMTGIHRKLAADLGMA
jgi:hypothetical protein